MKTAFIFQHYPPFPGAGARRAKSIVKNYVSLNTSENSKFYLLTSEAHAVEKNVYLQLRVFYIPFVLNIF